MTSIELGLKGDFFDNRLRVEGSIFNHDLDSQAVSEDAKQSPDDPTAQPTIITQDVETDDDSNAVIFTTGQWYFQDREMLSARIAWTTDDDNIEVALWGKNLLDKEIADNPDGLAADTLGFYRTSIGDPLTWGVDLRYSF